MGNRAVVHVEVVALFNVILVVRPVALARV
jgi:hypothetical protein